MAGPKKLRELVRDIRSAKTAAEERAIVNKECAEIRHSFRSENSTYRCRNVAKLLYIHMLGYPAHFGQLECLKLIASPRFTDKRVGHLGAMLLLDEKTDVHLLLTNSLKNDLNHSTPYVVSLALCTLGSICSAEICRDLAGEVERIIRSQNIYLKKKATLCAFRILKKVPDLLELFIPCTRNILAEKNHSVLLATVCLISEMCILSKEVLNHFRKETDLIPTLIRTMRNLVLVNYTNDSDVNRVSDPFLQVKILRLMRILGHGDRIVSDQLNDILTQVATNTETTKNVGHAILYEIVLTIMGIESDSGLKVLAINILGRFLLNSEKNIRYVALNTLKQVVHGDYQSVQRHRATILDCLKDPDASIRRRAIDLCFALINSSNIVHIMREILLYLSPKGLCEDDSKGDVCFNSLIACDMYAPNPKWLFEVILQMLLIVGNHAREDVVSSIISVVSQMNTEMHAYAVHNLYYAISSGEFHRQPLLQAAAWIIGEYGDLLVKPMQLTRNEEMQKSLHIVVPDAIYERFETHPTETQVIEILEKSLISSLCSNITKQMIVISLGKLSSRFTEVHLNKITSLVNHYSSSLNIELQQRSVELKMILTDSKSLRDGLLELMPVIESKMMANEENATADSNNILADDSDMSDLVDIIGNVCDRPLAANTNSVADNIFDQIIGMVNEDNGPTILPIANANPATNGQQNNDLLDIFGFDNGPNIERNIDSNPSKYPQTFASMKIFENSHLSIDLLPVRLNEAADNDIKLTITLRSPYSSVDAFELLVAVPKNLKLNLLPPSATRMTTSQPSITQEMNIVNSNKNTVKLRIKLSYQAEGLSKTEQFQVDSFPIQLWIN